MKPQPFIFSSQHKSLKGLVAKLELSDRVPLIHSRTPYPFLRFFKASFHSRALDIAFRKPVLRRWMPLLCRLAIPFNRFRVILLNTQSVFIRNAKFIRPVVIATLCRFAIPFYRLYPIFHYSMSYLVEKAHFTI